MVKQWWYPVRRYERAFHFAIGKFIPMTVPADDGRKPVESETKPEGEWEGPFHCEQCAVLCGSYGKTEDGAFRANHGTEDERFCEMLGYYA